MVEKTVRLMGFYSVHGILILLKIGLERVKESFWWPCVLSWGSFAGKHKHILAKFRKHVNLGMEYQHFGAFLINLIKNDYI